MGPELFVLDEPSSNLDGEGIRQLREILKQLKKGGKTVLMAEHRLWYAADLADRVFYLRSGQLEREYNGKDFLALPRRNAAPWDCGALRRYRCPRLSQAQRLEQTA